MKVIIGLGNPGEQYLNTRHNIGFIFLDFLVKFYNCNFSYEKKFKSDIAKIKINSENIIFAKPLTYMNNSGMAVRHIMDYYKIESLRDIIIITDDVNLPLAKIRIRKKGGAGGHNGLKSIIQHLGSNNFSRIRIGVDECPVNYPLDKYVLSNFNKNEKKIIYNLELDIIKIIDIILKENIDIAMNKFNG